ncbi:MAG: 50S ribosomal protein L11 methyltransferase [Limisphaerales bacterium]
MPPPPKPKHSPPLFALTVTTAPEAEEAVAELLLRTTGEAPITTFDRIRGISRVVVYLAAPKYLDAPRRRILRKGLEAIRDCGLDTGVARVGWSRVRAIDWKESWKRHFKPIAIGRALLVRPSWSRKRPSKGQAEIVLDPGLSFGTGQHPTTRFCLAELTRHRPRSGPSSLLDVGTGSGILALAAARLGYSPVRGVDFDPEAVAVARQNAIDTGLAESVSLARGDVARFSKNPRRRFNVVCANLTSDLLIRHADALAAQAVPGGVLILAGILAEEFDTVRTHYAKRGWVLVRHERRREWCSGSFHA